MKYNPVEQFGEDFGFIERTSKHFSMHQPKVMRWPATCTVHCGVGMTINTLRPELPPVVGIRMF